MGCGVCRSGPPPPSKLFAWTFPSLRSVVELSAVDAFELMCVWPSGFGGRAGGAHWSPVEFAELALLSVAQSLARPAAGSLIPSPS